MRRVGLRLGFLGLVCLAIMTPAIGQQQDFSQVKIVPMTQGMTMEQIVAAKPTKDFDEHVGNAAMSADRFVGQIYAELRGTGTR